MILNLLPFIAIMTSGNESSHEAAILTGEKKSNIALNLVSRLSVEWQSFCF